MPIGGGHAHRQMAPDGPAAFRGVKGAIGPPGAGGGVGVDAPRRMFMQRAQQHCEPNAGPEGNPEPTFGPICQKPDTSPDCAGLKGARRRGR
jgi:hypothetical protein